MIRFTFVVLHYQTFIDTVECVNSILQNIQFQILNIVIVNNGSTNDSGQLLEERFREKENVYYLDSKINLGFAKGNNLGFVYAKNELKSDFICLINNDTIVEQKNFVTEVIDKFGVQPFDIMGPDIISTIDGQHQNPETETCFDITSTLQKKKHYQRLLLLNNLGIEIPVVRFKRWLFPVREKAIGINILGHKLEQENVKLHGSCLIFSKQYIAKYEGLYPKTFMYCEESILNFIRKRDGLLSVYYPRIKILHKEDSSTNYEYPKDSRKRNFFYKNLVKSLNILIDLMNDYKPS